MNSVVEHPDGFGEAADLMAEAVTLARRGRYSEAERCLGEALARGECTEAESLDLLARIHVQKGRLLQAESCWQKALALDVGNTDYADALAALRRGQHPFARWRPVVIGGLVVLLLAIQAGVAVSTHRSAVQGRQDLEQRLTRLESALEGVRGEVGGVGLATARTMAPLAKTADVDASTRRAVADLRQDLERWQRDDMSRSRRDRTAILDAVGASEQRLDARLRTLEERALGTSSR